MTIKDKLTESNQTAKFWELETPEIMQTNITRMPSALSST